MKRVNEYRKLFSVEGEIDLKELKKTYRNLVKEWHPDKFQDGDNKALEAEVMSRKVIDGYHFLVSIAPATIEANKEEYLENIETGIDDFQHKGSLLTITFGDASTYEYFGVTRKIYMKFCNSDKPLRFAKRNICNSYLYRKAKKEIEQK